MLAALSLSWLYVAGLGAAPALALGPAVPDKERGSPHLLAAVWSFGLCINYALALAIGRLGPALALGAGLALLLGLAALWRNRSWLRPPRPAGPVALALLLLVVLAAAILLDPLNDWDARIIWFFQGKMIFFAGEISPGIGLRLPAVVHPDYPKLVPLLAAETAAMVGFWNEYLPKLSLVLLLPVPVLALLSLRQRPLSLALALSGFVAIPWQFINNGSMDGYLALYAGAAALFLADWLDGAGDSALLAAAGALGVAGGLKLEAEILYLAFGLAASALLLAGRLRLPRPSPAALLLLPLPFAGFVLWRALVWHWSLPVEHHPLETALMRLSQPHALRLIAERVLLDPRVVVAALLAAGGLILSRRCSAGLPAGAVLAVIAGLVYLAALCMVFLVYRGGRDIPGGLEMELATAAGRLVRTASALLLVGTVVALREVERWGALGRRSGP
ncbi:MAG TPA: hypothetical protein VFA23_05460 [Dongiaceae bacterium]|nr:hypothetical protein [Dongiaceae bacterium]